MFCGNIVVDGYYPKIIVVTVTAKVGIYHPNVKGVLNLEFVDSIATSRQQQGPASRKCQHSDFILVASIASFLMLYQRIEKVCDVKDIDDGNESSKLIRQSHNNMIHSPVRTQSMIEQHLKT